METPGDIQGSGRIGLDRNLLAGAADEAEGNAREILFHDFRVESWGLLERTASGIFRSANAARSSGCRDTAGF